MSSTVIAFDNRDYTLRWPPSLFREVTTSLVERGRRHSDRRRSDTFSWAQEVVVLLREAFPSGLPRTEFESLERQYPEDTHAERVDWLASLSSVAETLPLEPPPPPYHSERRHSPGGDRPEGIRSIVERSRMLIEELCDSHYFAETLGLVCIEGRGGVALSAETQLERRVGKGHLWSAPAADWTEDDLCNFLEVFHDVAARPVRGEYHDEDCEWHPTTYSPAVGRAVYRWRMNRVLERTALGYRFALDGEDVGRMVVAVAEPFASLIDEVLHGTTDDQAEIAHGIALFRDRTATPEAYRSAIIALARILENNRDLLKTELLSADENDLFKIANKFNLRHKDRTQQHDYRQEYLEWVFFWYLATIRLIQKLRRSHLE